MGRCSTVGNGGRNEDAWLQSAVFVLVRSVVVAVETERLVDQVIVIDRLRVDEQVTKLRCLLTPSVWRQPRHCLPQHGK
jgi:hypothetical protein